MDLPLIFVVIEDNVIIAEDIAEAIREYAASAVVHVWKRTEAQLDRLTELPGLCAAFVSMTAAEFARTGLHQMITARGGAIVVLDSDDPAAIAEASGWIYLEHPFTTGQIHWALKSVGIAKTDLVP